MCIDIIIKSISPRIMSHTQSPLGSFSPVIIGLPIPPGFIYVIVSYIRAESMPGRKIVSI